MWWHADTFPTVPPRSPFGTPFRPEGLNIAASSHNCKLTESQMKDTSKVLATAVVIHTCAGARVLWLDALPDGCPQVLSRQPACGALIWSDANRKRLVATGTISRDFRGGGLGVPCKVEVVDILSVPDFLRCDSRLNIATGLASQTTRSGGATGQRPPSSRGPSSSSIVTRRPPTPSRTLKRRG